MNKVRVPKTKSDLAYQLNMLGYPMAYIVLCTYTKSELIEKYKKFINPK